MLPEMWNEHDNCRRRTELDNRWGGGSALLPDVISYSSVKRLPWPSGRLSALRNEGLGFETSAWQTKYKPPTDVRYFRSRVCPFATHKPILNLCTRFHAHGVGPSRFSIQDRYLFPAPPPPPHPCKVRWMAISDRPNAMLALPVIRQNSPLHGRCDEDLMGQVPRLWNCLKAAAMESQLRYTD
jgi:hypothetical protein